MPYDIRLVKLINGDMALGKYDDAQKKLTEVALLQTVPTQQGAQMMLLPFGYPFEQDMKGELSWDHVMYQYKDFPEELKTKYLEATSNITLSTGGLGGLDLTGGGGNVSDLSSLLKK